MKSYKPKDHGQNRMLHEGDVIRARDNYFNGCSNNLFHLLENRFSWMNEFIDSNSFGIEVGCGTGISKEFIKCDNFLLTDYSDNEWLDQKMVDALNTGFSDNSLDFVLSSNMIHHVPYPFRFFEEMNRILKPGGKLIIQEINCSKVMQALLRLMRHEGYDFNINVFDENIICTDPEDLWSANCAIPNLLFDDLEAFKTNFPYFEAKKTSFSEFLIFINSGGVISKTAYLPLPKVILRLLCRIDDFLANKWPNVFALQRQIVLEKVSHV